MSDYQQNIVNAEKTATYYNNLWTTVGAKLHYTEISRARFIVDSIRKFVGCNGLKILDFGCGRGWMAPFLSPLGSVTGIDFSPIGIQFAKENYGKHADFLLADSQSSVFDILRDYCFDVVVCSEVIEHVPNHLELLSQIYQLLYPHGWCMFTTPNGNVWPQFSRDPQYRNKLQPIENWVTTRQLASLFQQAGFRILIHEGRPVYEFRVGFAGWLQRRPIESLFKKMGLYSFYGRLILPNALYQVTVAQKII